MLARPYTNNQLLKCIWTQKAKFNDSLANILSVENYMHVMKIPDMEEQRYFDIWGKLTDVGETHFWWNLDEEFSTWDASLRTTGKPPSKRKPNNVHRDNSRRHESPPQSHSQSSSSINDSNIRIVSDYQRNQIRRQLPELPMKTYYKHF